MASIFVEQKTRKKKACDVYIYNDTSFFGNSQAIFLVWQKWGETQ